MLGRGFFTTVLNYFFFATFLAVGFLAATFFTAFLATFLAAGFFLAGASLSLVVFLLVVIGYLLRGFQMLGNIFFGAFNNFGGRFIADTLHGAQMFHFHIG